MFYILVSKKNYFSRKKKDLARPEKFCFHVPHPHGLSFGKIFFSFRKTLFPRPRNPHGLSFIFSSHKRPKFPIFRIFHFFHFINS